MGISPLHDPHQVAQMLNIVPLPREARARWLKSDPVTARRLGMLMRVPMTFGDGTELSDSVCDVRPLQDRIGNSPMKASR